MRRGGAGFIEGEIVQMAPIGPRHIGRVINATRLFKARLYARAGIAEFWLCLAADGAVEVYRRPSHDGYAGMTLHGPGQIVSPLAFPDVTFAVTDFFA